MAQYTNELEKEMRIWNYLIEKQPSKWLNLTKYTPMLVEKNYRWIWIVVDRYGKRFISFVCGGRLTQTGLKLWDRLKQLKVNRFTSDY